VSPARPTPWFAYRAAVGGFHSAYLLALDVFLVRRVDANDIAAIDEHRTCTTKPVSNVAGLVVRSVAPLMPGSVSTIKVYRHR
jgi:hypothetical protein